MREHQLLRIKLLKTLLEFEEELLNDIEQQLPKIKSKAFENYMIDQTQQPNIPNKEVFTVMDLSNYLGVSKDSIYTMVRENQIPFLRVRRRIVFHRQTIDSWIKSGFISRAIESPF